MTAVCVCECVCVGVGGGGGGRDITASLHSTPKIADCRHIRDKTPPPQGINKWAI